MDGIKYAVLIDKSVQLLAKNQYTFNFELGSTRTEVKRRRMGPIVGHTMHYRRMIITLQPGYSIPLLRKKKKNLNQNT